jgi:Flp pilus assembly protein TadG
MGSKKWARRLRWRRQNEEGAEMIEFAIVFALVLLPIFYGIISFGCLFLVKTSTAQAADDASRAGLTEYNYDIGIGDSTTTAETNAESVAASTVARDLNWLPNSSTCTSSSPSSTHPIQCVSGFFSGSSATSLPTGGTETCASGVSGETDTCFYVSIAYGYAQDPLIPPAVFAFVTPSTLTTTATQLVPN